MPVQQAVEAQGLGIVPSGVQHQFSQALAARGRLIALWFINTQSAGQGRAYGAGVQRFAFDSGRRDDVLQQGVEHALRGELVVYGAHFPEQLSLAAGALAQQISEAIWLPGKRWPSLLLPDPLLKHHGRYTREPIKTSIRLIW
jgi:hypothetical protein